MRDKIVARIRETKKYSKFKLMDANRFVDPNHVERIKKSMTECYIPSPILVNEKFQIIDGQHRFTAVKSLGLPVHYLIINGLGYDEVIRLNVSQKNWGMKEYYVHHLRQRKPAYLELQELADQFEVDVMRVMDLHGWGVHARPKVRARDAFKDGSFEIVEPGKLLQRLEWFNEIKHFWDFSETRSFCRAFKKVSLHPNFNFQRFLRQASNYGGTLEKQPDTEAYAKAFQDLYNFKRKHRTRIYNDL